MGTGFWKLALVLAAVASTERVASPQGCTLEGGDICELDWTALWTPTYQGIQRFSGLAGGVYSKSGLLAPEPIPMWVKASDRDKIHVHCGGRCQALTVPGTWTANWTRSGPGDFVNSTVSLVGSVNDAWSALFLPSDSLGIGETSTTTVTATLVGTCSCPGYDDAPRQIKFQVTTAKNAEQDFDVTVTHLPLGLAYSPLVPCRGTDPDCDLFVGSNQGDSPWAAIAEYPTMGMIKGEIRPLRSMAEDLDEYQAECGTTPGHYPVESNFGYQKYCDELTYSWSVITGPGSGTFVAQGRSTFFRATAEGSVTIRVVAMASDGESAFADVTFTIHEPQILKLDFGDTHPIARDDGGGDYDSTLPEWEDMNDDGDASDMNERRVSAVYTRATEVVLDQVWFECGTKPPPYGVIKGTGPDSQEFKTTPCTSGTVGMTELSGCDMTASTALPNMVKKYDPYTIDWEISFIDDTFVSAGSTDNWLYVLLADPVGGYSRFETLYDVGCIAASGATSANATFNAIWNHVKGLSVNRKSRDGFNDPDGIQMGYYLEPTTVCQDLAGMLADETAPEGDGRCQAWAELLEGCVEMHGVGNAQIYTVTYPPAGPTGGIMVKNWEAPPVICMGANGISNTVANVNDTVVVPFGNGWPNVGPVVGLGPNGTLNTTPGGDDVAYGPGIHTGPNGVCQSTAVPDDTQNLAVGLGLPHNVLPTNPHPVTIYCGPDGVLDSAPAPDDHLFTITTNLIIGVQIFDKPGIAGQNNGDPLSTFTNHAVIHRGGQIYDPSYGVGPFALAGATCPGHENASLDAVSNTGTRADLQDTTVSELDYSP